MVLDLRPGSSSNTCSLSGRPIQVTRPSTSTPKRACPYVDIRKQWERLMVIASRMLRYDLEDKKRTFFNFRHTGASHIAQRGKTPAHLLGVVQMRGDTSLRRSTAITSRWSRS